MKVVFINGSPNSNGSSSILVNKIITGINTTNKLFGEIKSYCLGDTDLKFCLGCKSCYIDGNCVQSDDFIKMFSDIEEADYVVLISPSYWGDITGQMKVFFDRTTPFCDTNNNRKFLEKERRGISIAVRTGLNESENIHIIDTMEHYFSHLNIKPVDRLSVRGVETPMDLYQKPDYLELAHKIGENIANNKI